MAYAMGDYVIPENAEIETNPSLREGEEPQSFVWVPLGKASGGGTILDVKHPPGCILIKVRNGVYMGMIALPHGVHTIAKPEERPPYTSLHPRSISLARCEGDARAASLSFLIHRELTLNFELLKSRGHIESLPVPLYHAHVLWAYAIRLERRKGGNYALSIVSARSHLQHRSKNDGYHHYSNPPGLEAPPVLDVLLCLVNSTTVDVLPVEVQRSGEDLHATREFSRQELIDLAAGSTLKVSVEMLVKRAYFSLSSIIDLDKKPTETASARDTVATILRGRKPAGYDWQITGVTRMSKATISSVYYVHKEVFRRVSKPIQAAFNRQSPANVTLLNGGKAGTLTDFNDDDIKLAIRIAYGVEVPLPGPDVSGRPVEYTIGRMNYLFKDHFLEQIIPQWEREICRRALAFDMHNPASCMVDLLHFLNVCWEAPIGWFPVAERVCIGVLADMVHLNARASEELFMKESVVSRFKESCIANKRVMEIVEKMQLLLHGMQRVSKTAVAVEKGDVTDVEDSDSSAVNSGDSSSVEEQEEEKEDTVGNTVEKMEQREDYDIESGQVEAEDKWTCAIS